MVISKGQNMKPRLPKHQPATPGVEAFLVQWSGMLDRSIPALRTAFILAGLVAAAARSGASADFLFVTGLLFQLAIWFEHWLIAKRTL